MLCISVCEGFVTTAQDSISYVITTDRPSVSFSAATVPKNILVVETGYLQTNQESNTNKTIFINPNIFVRYGVGKRLELRLGEEFLAIYDTNKLNSTSTNTADFLPIALGVKYRINNPENNRWALSALWASKVPIPNHIENTALRHYGRILGQYSLKKTCIFSNVGMDFTHDRQNPNTFLTHTFGIGRNLLDELYAFVENFGFYSLKSSSYSKAANLNAGIVYIIKSRYQIDATWGVDLETSIRNYHFFTIGFSVYFR